MLERIESPENVLAFRAVGKVEKTDYENTLDPAVTEMIERRDEIRFVYVLGDDFDGVSAISQNALITVQVGDGAGGRARVDVPLVEGNIAGLGPELGDVDRMFVFGAHDDRQIDLLIAKSQFGRLAHRGIPFSHGAHRNLSSPGFSP